VLPVSLRSLLTQNYPGDFQIVLVDDHSTDGTSEVAKKTAEALKNTQKLHVILAEPLPTGWSGKLWAMEQGVRKAQAFSPEYILLTDADIEHDASNLSRLVAKTVEANLDMASVMVRLRCESFWEQLLIPAFVFFFQKLYPFRWVNNPAKRTAGAAGGCILIRHEALERIGGIQAIRQALIDDCSLAEKVKALPGKIWLGLSDQTHSLRPYPSLKTIWNMVARTAYTQLNYNPVLLLGTLVGMTLVYLVPPIAFFVGSITGQWTIAITGLITYLLMTLAYFPTVHFYKVSPAFAFCLPAIAFLYSLMTLDSAVRHWQGRGGAWKGRVYPG
jgi:hopene-associated glycosyltransferase HpnB